MNRKYRKTIIAGNWKMNKTASETVAFANEIKPLLPKTRACEAVLCVPALNITTAQKALKGCRISVGAQTLHYEKSGAFTGEISADMLDDLGVKYVIIGHSERREYYGETDATVNRKVLAALAAGLTPIVCVGESLDQRMLGVEKELLAYQLMTAISGVSAEDMKRIVIAYEPVWAIGTGKTATSEQAQEVCEHIRACIRKKYDARIARGVSILYGGSMNVKNAAELLKMPDIDGGLIGGASLKPADFAQLIEISAQVENE
ncbi:MAG: triose-phosphate isomerase [Ruminococcaceae bacterium]|nr:triose-phosphate isomerase [Oscillospiraceae bacterium]